MTIRALSRQEFDRFGSAQWTLGGLTRRAVEWFADDTGDVFGVIADHGSDLDWSYAVLAREHAGKFRALALDFGFRDANDARRLLFEKMEMAIVTGPRRRVFAATGGLVQTSRSRSWNE